MKASKSTSNAKKTIQTARSDGKAFVFPLSLQCPVSYFASSWSTCGFETGRLLSSRSSIVCPTCDTEESSLVTRGIVKIYHNCPSSVLQITILFSTSFDVNLMARCRTSAANERWAIFVFTINHKAKFVNKQYRALSKFLKSCMQLFTSSDRTLPLQVQRSTVNNSKTRQLAKPIRRSMLIYEPISSDNSRTLYEFFDKENSSSFLVFASYNRTCFHSSYLVQICSSKEITLEWNLINFREFKLRRLFRHIRIRPRGRYVYNPTSPIGTKRKRIQASTSLSRRGMKKCQTIQNMFSGRWIWENRLCRFCS